MPVTPTVRRIFHIPTGDLSDPDYALRAVDDRLSPTAFRSPEIAVLDLRGKLLSPVSLSRLILTLGQRLRGGVYGNLKLAVLTSHADIRTIVELLAEANDLPIFIADAPEEIEHAHPAGDLTASERDTLGELQRIGGQATAAAFAGHAGMTSSAATNRLVNLVRKGYLYRVERGRRDGDLFVDPRLRPGAFVVAGEEMTPPRHALLEAGINSDPYDTSPVTLEGEAAERAAAILRKHGHAL